MTLLVRDDRQAVEYNIAYHLSQGVDYIIATDNRSRDGARDVLLHYQKLGVLHLIDEPADDFSQPNWVARMARIAYEHAHADWVIHVDVDEYWWPLQGDFKDGLKAIGPEEDILQIHRFNFWPLTEPKEPFWRHMVHREVQHSITSAFGGGPLPPKICHRAVPEVDLNVGNHKISSPYLSAVSDQKPFIIFHFPYRSYEQLEDKISKGGKALRANKQIPESLAGRWRLLYDLYLRGQLQEWYQSVPKISPLTEDAQESRITKDTRLRDFMEELMVRSSMAGSKV